MIDYGRLIFIGCIATILFGGGFWVGNSRYLNYKAEVEQVAKTQEEKIKSIRSQQELVNKGISDAYEAKLSALRNYYGNGVQYSSSRSMSSISATPKGTDAETAYPILARQCAETTLQVNALQDWVIENIGIK